MYDKQDEESDSQSRLTVCWWGKRIWHTKRELNPILCQWKMSLNIFSREEVFIQNNNNTH